MPKWLTISVIVLLIIGGVLVAMAPLGPMPGLFIGGKSAQAPEQWSQVNIPGEVLLETRGGALPRVVTIWIVEHSNDLYVFGDQNSGWVQATSKAPAIRLRMDDQTYDLHAEPVKNFDANVYQAYMDRYQADYPDIVASFPPADQVLDQVAGFRLRR